MNVQNVCKLLHLELTVASPEGQPRRSHQREDEAECGERLPMVFRRGSGEDLPADGERLVQTLCEIQTDPGAD